MEEDLINQAPLEQGARWRFLQRQQHPNPIHIMTLYQKETQDDPLIELQALVDSLFSPNEQEHVCPKCATTLIWCVKQMRSADEGSTVVWSCVDCQFTKKSD